MCDLNILGTRIEASFYFLRTGNDNLDGGIGSVDDHHELKEERPPQDIVVPDIETSHLKCQHLSALVFPRPTGHIQIDVSDSSGRLP
jgi:hypothetical protein